ncbi:MAG TPA: hypothetical protein VJJ48_00280 [Candidatus Paceibacterota bacterium]
MDQTQKGGVGTAVTIVVALLVLLGGYWFWNNRADNEMSKNATSTAEEMSNSDEVSDIEADLNSTTEFNSPDYDLDEENYNAS